MLTMQRREMKRRRRRRRVVASVLGGGAAAALLVGSAGCAGPSGPGRVPVGLASEPGAPALPSASVAGFYDERGALLAERFEFSRSNEEVGARRARPRVASEQWPSRPQPAERPVRFERWEQ